MTWTYDSTNLDKSTQQGQVNIVRYLVGDTYQNDQQVQDEEIEFALSENNSDVYLTASWVARTIAAKYARRVDTELDSAIRENLSDLSKQYRQLAIDLKNSAQRSGGLGIFAGGIDVSKRDTTFSDDTLVQPAFIRGKFSGDN